ncbi:hypothetical protein NBRC116602_28870 [Hyphomicrobiales bacterium 4NK60-0047b]
MSNKYKSTPFFTVITVVFNDAWALFKTTRSVFRQNFKDFEYLVIDGNSADGTTELIDFWKSVGMITNSISEPDGSVYEAMNKGLRLANGKFVCFMNAGDVFADDQVIEKVYQKLQNTDLDGVLGWGGLNDQIWASWVEGEAFKLSSLGFCHQSLYVKRSLLLQTPFDQREFKTDSDTLQLGRLYSAGANISIVPEVLAIRGNEPGISADLKRTKASIKNTIIEEYPSLSSVDAEKIIEFRRKCSEPEWIISLSERSSFPLNKHIAYMILDTLFQGQSKALSEEVVVDLIECASKIISLENSQQSEEELLKLKTFQNIRSELLFKKAIRKKILNDEISKFEKEESCRIKTLKARRSKFTKQKTTDSIVTLTSFPARLSTLHFVIESIIEQSVRPKEIHVWLGADEVPNKSWLPAKLIKLEQYGLKLNFAKRTFHQYDKFLHNYDLNQRSPFILVDDDVIYPENSIESLVAEHQKHPKAVIANRCHKIKLKDGLRFAPYKEWQREVRAAQPSLVLMPTGAGGVLYPPGFLNHPDVRNIRDILTYAPYADDIWLKICSLALAIPTKSTHLSDGCGWYHRYTPTMMNDTLMATNVEKGLNDIQINRCVDWLTIKKPSWRSEFLRDYEVGHLC